MIRAFAVVRAFVLRAGQLTENGDDLFQLSITEVLAVLSSDTEPLSAVGLLAPHLRDLRGAGAVPDAHPGFLRPAALGRRPGPAHRRVRRDPVGH